MKLFLITSLILLSTSAALADGEDDGCSASEGPRPAHCGSVEKACEGVVSRQWGYRPDPYLGWAPGEQEKYLECQRAIYAPPRDHE